MGCTYGFIVFDGNHALIAVVTDDEYKIKEEMMFIRPHFNTQSTVQMARQRAKVRRMNLSRVVQKVAKYFTEEEVILVVLAGLGNMKAFFSEHEEYINLGLHLVAIIDTGYGGENGLKQAIKLFKELKIE